MSSEETRIPPVSQKLRYKTTQKALYNTLRSSLGRALTLILTFALPLILAVHWAEGRVRGSNVEFVYRPILKSLILIGFGRSKWQKVQVRRELNFLKCLD